jgi:putative methionine-R-sulfoxide reductase with GAF domain
VQVGLPSSFGLPPVAAGSASTASPEARSENLAWSGPAAPAYPDFPIDQGLTGAAIRSRSSVVSNNAANDPRHLTNQQSTGSELIVPVLREGTVVGTLDIEDPSSNAFDDEDQTLFELLAAALSDLCA